MLVLLILLTVYYWTPINIWLFSNEGIPARLNLAISALLGGIIGFILVLVIETLKNSAVTFYDVEPVPVDKRKILKIGVRVISVWREKAPLLAKYLPANVHALATLTVHINSCTKPKYRAKWDNAPEPWSYNFSTTRKITVHGNLTKDNKKSSPIEFVGNLSEELQGSPRPEMIPFSMQPENLLPGDNAEASIVVKYDGEHGFHIFDPDYYLKDYAREYRNYCNCDKAYLRIVFKSSLGSWENYYFVSNPNTGLTDFTLHPILKEEYQSNVI